MVNRTAASVKKFGVTVAAGTIKTVLSGLPGIANIAVDSAGDLYFSEGNQIWLADVNTHGERRGW